MSDPMPDERLAQISIAALSPFSFDHPATRIVVDAFAELVTEVKRSRAELAAANERGERAETAGLNSQQAENERFNALRGSNFALRAEIDRLEARLAEIGEVRQEWRFDDGAGWFTVSRKPLSDTDVRHLQKATGRPVEHRLVGEWREVPDAAGTEMGATETGAHDLPASADESTGVRGVAKPTGGHEG